MIETRKEEHVPAISDWERVRAISEDEIEALAASDEDNLPTDEAYWAKAVIVSPLTLSHLNHLDADVVDWFRLQGSDYWDRLNDVLRNHMEAHTIR